MMPSSTYNVRLDKPLYSCNYTNRPDSSSSTCIIALMVNAADQAPPAYVVVNGVLQLELLLQLLDKLLR